MICITVKGSDVLVEFTIEIDGFGYSYTPKIACHDAVHANLLAKKLRETWREDRKQVYEEGHSDGRRHRPKQKYYTET